MRVLGSSWTLKHMHVLVFENPNDYICILNWPHLDEYVYTKGKSLGSHPTNVYHDRYEEKFKIQIRFYPYSTIMYSDT
jgi:hypothetical protein